MDNNTLEDLYKKAVKEKYEVEKNGDDFFFLNPPTRGKLNKLCWEKFTNNDANSNDLNVFNSLLGLSFDINAKNKFKQQTNPFRPIENFFKGESDPDKIEVVDMAAILVDFQPRPFNKFRKEIDPENQKLIDELRDTEHHKSDFFSDTLVEEVENENFPDSKNEESEKDKNEEIEQDENQGREAIPTDIVDVSPPVKIGGDNFGKSGISRYLVIVAFLVVGLIIYLTMSQKDCMQWSNDHYVRVSCDLDAKGLASFNVVEPFDKTVFDLRKIKISDTTPCFDKNGDAIIWYAKTANGIDFFNGHGRHPENNSSLKPITKYILNKYVKNKH